MVAFVWYIRLGPVYWSMLRYNGYFRKTMELRLIIVPTV